MAIISGVTVRWGLSPRLIVIPTAETEVTLEDLQDTLQDIEDDSQGMPFDKLRSLSGGQELDASTSVGFTMQLNNAQLIWATNVSVLDSGTITTPDMDGLVLNDSTGLFVTNGVEPGDMVVNQTDGSHATVLSVPLETQILVDALIGGADNQFDSADVYTIFDWQVRSLTGGNLVAINSSGTPISPVLNSFGNSFDRTSSSSATNSSSDLIEEASYLGGIWVDVIDGQPGTGGLIGNHTNPSNNMTDAYLIDSVRNFKTFFIEKSLTLNDEGDWTDHTFKGHSIIDTVITVNPIADVTKTIFTECSIEGNLGSTTLLDRCFLGETNSLTNVRGVITNCSIGPSPLTLGGGPADGGTIADQVRMNDCRAAGLAFAPPTIDGNGDGPQLVIQGHIGTLNLANKTGEAPWKITINGDLTLESTVTNGVIEVFGQGSIIDNSGPNCTVIPKVIDGGQLTALWKTEGLQAGNKVTRGPQLIYTADGDINIQRNLQQSAMDYGGVFTETLERIADPAIVLELPLISDLLDTGSRYAPTYTCASTSTYFDTTTGLMVVAAIDEPRFEADGVLIEEERTNYMLRSEEFNVSLPWVHPNTTVTADAIAGPDGLVTADKIEVNTTASTQNYQTTNGIGDAGGMIFSVFAKQGSGPNDSDRFMLRNITTAQNLSQIVFDYSDGSVNQVTGTDPVYVEEFANDWWRIGLSGINVNANDDMRGYVGYTTATFTAGEYLYVIGAQMETGLFSTSYIPTVTTTQTRSASFLNYGDDTIISDLAGTIICTVTPLFGSTAGINAVLVNCADQLIGPLYIVDDTTQKFACSDGTNVVTFDPTFTVNQSYTVAVRWSVELNEMQIIVDGMAGAISAYDGGFTRNVGNLFVGSNSTGNHFNGNIKTLKIYNNDRGEDQLKVDTG